MAFDDLVEYGDQDSRCSVHVHPHDYAATKVTHDAPIPTRAAQWLPGELKLCSPPMVRSPAAADTTRLYYDAGRRVTGVVGPDPDGGGALPYRALRTTYNLVGQPTVVERGTVTNQGDSAFASFTPLEKQDTIYDTFARPTQARLWNGGGAPHVHGTAR